METTKDVMKLNSTRKKQQLSIKGAFMIIFHRVPLESRKHMARLKKLTTSYPQAENF